MFGADHAQFAVGYVAGYRAACGHNRIAANFDRRDQRTVAADERAFANHRLIFEIAVIIAGDGASADVRACANDRVAQIGQMIGLCALAQMGFFGFDEIADLCLFLQNRSGPEPRKGADFAALTDDRAFNMAVCADFYVVRYADAGAKKDIGFDQDIAAKLRIPRKPDRFRCN